jgi:cell division protease FtsH
MANPEPRPAARRQRLANLLYALAAVLAVVWLQQVLSARVGVEDLAYSEFEAALARGEIAEVDVYPDRLEGRYRHARPGGAERFVTQRVDPALVAALGRAGVRYRAVTQSDWLPQLLSWVVPTVLFIALWWFIFRRTFAESAGAGSLMAIGRSKARVYVETDTKVTFADVAGVDEAKAELVEVVGFLREPGRYGRLGARLPKGVLLVGPPGTGKTLLARAVAGEAGVPFFSINGSEFVEMFVGVGAARVRDLFDQARAHAPAIIFIDELDALGRARGAFGGLGGHDEKEQTLNQLLSELDGFDPRKGLVLLAATNRPEILDPALLRPGRFDRQILVDRPDRTGRVQILKVHVRRVQVAPELDLDEVAALTPGFTGADLANLVNEAALVATRRGAVATALDDFTAAIERIVAGLEKRNRLLNPLERRIVAVHEMGHALVALSLPGADPVQKVSIIPRGIGALGYTIQRPIEDRFLMTRTELDTKLAVLLAGRAAERLLLTELSTGAADDLTRATTLARAIVARYGMSERLGSVAYEAEPSPLPGVPLAAERPTRSSDATEREIDLEVRAILQSAERHALDLLTARRAELERGAALLLEKETLGPAELAGFASGQVERGTDAARP